MDVRWWVFLIILSIPLAIWHVGAADINWTYDSSRLDTLYNDTLNNSYTSGWLPQIANSGDLDGWALLKGIFMPITTTLGWVIIPLLGLTFMGVVYMSGHDPLQVAAIALFLEAALAPLLHYGYLSDKWFLGIAIITVGYIVLRIGSRRG